MAVSRLGTGLALAAALAAGFGGGWIAGRASLPPPLPPDVFRNPLAEVAKGESLVLTQGGGLRQEIRVAEVTPDSVLLAITTWTRGVPPSTRHLRVARNYAGTFHILEGDDIDGAAAAGILRDFIPSRVEPMDLALKAMEGRVVRCWKVSGTTLGGDARAYWISADFPVHGLLRADGPTGTVWELESFSGAVR